MPVRVLPKFPWGLPWFMFDLSNRQLITSSTKPGDIRDTKGIVLTETPVPGLSYQPVTPMGTANRKVGFTLPIVKQDFMLGNILLVKQFEALRHQAAGFLQWTKRRFAPTPKVLYYWGVGSVPLVWWVSKCELRHREGWYNKAGLPMVSDVDIELTLDEEHPLNRAEDMFRALAPIASQFRQLFDAGADIVKTLQFRLTHGAGVLR